MQNTANSSSLINNCINKLTRNGIWKPLPEREFEIGQINYYIDRSFKKEVPLFLIISGPQSCGKTSVLHTCALMSEFENLISFVDSQNDDTLSFIQKLHYSNDECRKLIILDNFNPQQHFNLFSIISNLNFSIFLVMQNNEIIDNFPILPDIDCIRFSRYTLNQIQNILIEYVGEYLYIIPNGIIHNISNEVIKNNGSIQDAFQMLINFLHDYSMNNNALPSSNSV